MRHAMRWYTQMGRRVWFYEVWNFLFRDRRLARARRCDEFWGAPQDAEVPVRIVCARDQRSKSASVRCF